MLINGIKSNQINALDRGLAYGDGLFTTINVEFGVAQLWEFHLQRFDAPRQATNCHGANKYVILNIWFDASFKQGAA